MIITKNNGITARCGRRGCKVVVLPTDDLPNVISGSSERKFISISGLSSGRTPTWQVVRWDIDEPAAKYLKAVG